MEKKEVLELLENVYDPDYRDRSIVEMGLVSEEDIEIWDDRIEIHYTLTAPMCPYSAAIGVMIRYALEKKLKKPVKVRIKPGQFQEKIVNEILENEEKSREQLELLRSYGILERCIRI